MKAWAIYHDRFDALLVYAAATRGKAIAAALHSARDAGYKATWGDFKARRYPQFDALATIEDCRPYSLGYHARGYDLHGDFTGWDQFGCLDGQRVSPEKLYATIGKEARP